MNPNLPCYNCTAKRICNIYNFIKQYDDLVNINLIDCKIFNQSLESQTPPTPVPNKDSLIREYKNFNQETNLDNKKKEKKLNVTITDKILDFKDIEPCICPSCNANTFTKNIIKCSKCGKEICIDCATVEVDIDTGEKNYFCEDCW